MSSDKNSNNLDQKFTIEKLIQFLKNLLDLIIDFKAGIIVIITWLVVAQFSGYSLTSIIWSIIKLILYPLNLLLFNTQYRSIDVPEVFILLVPLVVLTTVGFLIIISTED
jgi:hypothetical protein